MYLFPSFLLLVACIECLAAEQNFGGNSVSEKHPLEEQSKFKKFLNLFGIGSSKQFQSIQPQYMPEFNTYHYPCPISTTTTTTPAPVVLSPLLCPFPPMVSPAHIKPPLGDGEIPQHGTHPGGLDQLPISPSVLLPLAPGIVDSPEAPSSASLFPAIFPQNPQQDHPTPIFIPIHSGQKPQFPFPGPSVPIFPDQSIHNPYPIQNLPNPVHPGQGHNVPTLPAPFHPHGSNPHSKPLQNPEKPTMVDPLKVEPPVKVTPVVTKPFDPIKVNPTVVDPTKPVHVTPVDIQPSQPLLVDPATIHPNQPIVIDPLKPPPTLNIESFPPPPSYNDPKSFSKYPAVSPFGPTNVLINPGFPEQPFPQPTSPRPSGPLGIHRPSGKPLPPKGPFVRPLNVLVNPGLPIDPPQNFGLPNTNFINPAFPPKPFLPSDGIISPENFHLIPLIPIQVLPNRPSLDGKPLGPFIPPPIGNENQGNQTLPPPPSHANISLPPPPSLHDKAPLEPPPSANDPIAFPTFDGNSYLPNVPPYPPAGGPLNPILMIPELSRPPCGTPFLKPYVPQGFHLSSVNQFIGMPPVPNPRFNFPCPTLDLLQTLDFNVMRTLIKSSGLLPLFEHTKNYTLFLPSDAAFRRLPRWFRDSLDVDTKLKKALLLNHLVKEDLPLSVLENEELVLSARPGGHRLRINIYETGNTYRTITVDGAEVEKGDIITSNGRVHIVNKVLMPNLPRNAAQFLSEKLEFEGFWNLVKQADLVQNFQDLRPFTLFIPVNEAVHKLNDSAFLSDRDKLKNFVNYHLVNGTYYSNGLINNEFLLTNYEKEIKMQVTSDTFSRSLTGINGRVRILKSDITLTNGVAHVIDQCISDETPFYVYPQSDEFKNEYGVLRRSFRVTGKEKNIEHAF